MQGSVREIAVDLVRPDGSKLPALVNSVLRYDEAGRPAVIRTTVFDATDRRRYEQELLHARRREQGVALELQRSLLAGALTDAEELEIGVAYHPADKGLEVGGDWYDAFWLVPEETLAVVVGDVVGRGLAAAATMGQLRSALRALASTGFEPGALLEALSEFSRRHELGQMATVAYAEIDVRLGLMRYACAGHPPPVVVEPAKPARLASEGRSPPLDAHSFWTDRPDASVRLPPGAMVVFYSDGLIERTTAPCRRGWTSCWRASTSSATRGPTRSRHRSRRRGGRRHDGQPGRRVRARAAPAAGTHLSVTCPPASGPWPPVAASSRVNRARCTRTTAQPVPTCIRSSLRVACRPLTLTVLAAVLAFGGLTASYVKLELADPDAFADRSLDALRSDAVKSVIAEQIVVALLERRSPDLVATRPLVITAVEPSSTRAVLAGDAPGRRDRARCAAARRP
jgi:hypothetical protein